MMSTMKNGIKTYSELIQIPSFQDRLEYLRLDSFVGFETFGSKRYLNQLFYNSRDWKDVRNNVILRDNGCDLAHPDYQITGKIMIHHLNPITIEDIVNRRSCVFDMENLVCASFDVHELIHYGRDTNHFFTEKSFAVRTKNDTCLWR